jgi:hypothetical protein
MASVKFPIAPSHVDSHQSIPNWLAVVVRFDHFRTQDREKVSGAVARGLNVSSDAALADPMSERSPILLSSQIVEWNVIESKSSAASSANFRLAPVAPFSHIIRAGDWILFWAFNDPADYERVRTNVRHLLSSPTGPDLVVNDFRDGLKFVGRCNAPKRDEAMGADGTPRTIFDLTCVGFSEFETDVYWTPAYAAFQEKIAGSNGGAAASLAPTVTDLDDLMAAVEAQSTTTFVKLWLKTFLGEGPGELGRFSAPDGQEVSANDPSTIALSPNSTFRIPSTVARLLGTGANVGQRPTYADILQRFIGVQGPGEVGVDLVTGMRPTVAGEVSGSYMVSSVGLENRLWDLIRGYANQPINEVFTCLRPGPDGRIRPTFMCRQSPYSSRFAAGVLKNLDPGFTAVPFADLPRWVLDPRMVPASRLGPSDSLRYNYVQVSGIQYVAGDAVTSIASNLALTGGPAADLADIERSGLRRYQGGALNCLLTPVEASPSNPPVTRGQTYVSFLADIALNQQYKWNGTLTMYGVALPIALGDNVEYRRVIYQIEGISHFGRIDATSGRRTFRTTLQVSNGISTLSDLAADDVFPHEEVANSGEALSGEIDGAPAILFDDTFISLPPRRGGINFETTEGGQLGELGILDLTQHEQDDLFGGG